MNNDDDQKQKKGSAVSKTTLSSPLSLKNPFPDYEKDSLNEKSEGASTAKQSYNKNKENEEEEEEYDNDIDMDCNLREAYEFKRRKEEYEAKLKEDRTDIFLTGAYGMEKEELYSKGRLQSISSMRRQEKDIIFGLSALGEKYQRGYKVIKKSQNILRKRWAEKFSRRVYGRSDHQPKKKRKLLNKGEEEEDQKEEGDMKVNLHSKGKKIPLDALLNEHVGEYSPCLDLHSVVSSEANLNDVLSDVKMLFPVDDSNQKNYPTSMRNFREKFNSPRASISGEETNNARSSSGRYGGGVLFCPDETSLESKNIDLHENMKAFIESEEGLMQSYPAYQALKSQTQNAKRRRWQNFVHFYLTSNLLPSGCWPIPIPASADEERKKKQIPLSPSVRSIKPNLTKTQAVMNESFPDSTVSSLSLPSTYLPSHFLDLKKQQLLCAHNRSLSWSKFSTATKEDLTPNQDRIKSDTIEDINPGKDCERYEHDNGLDRTGRDLGFNFGNINHENLNGPYSSLYLDTIFPASAVQGPLLEGTKVIGTGDEVWDRCRKGPNMDQSQFERFETISERKSDHQRIEEENIDNSASSGRKYVRMEAPVLCADGIVWKEIQNRIVRFQFDSYSQENQDKQNDSSKTKALGSDNLGVQRTVDKILLECAPHVLSQNEKDGLNYMGGRNLIQKELESDCISIVDHLLEDIFVKCEEQLENMDRSRQDRQKPLRRNWEDVLRILEMMSPENSRSDRVFQNARLRTLRYLYPQGCAGLQSWNENAEKGQDSINT